MSGLLSRFKKLLPDRHPLRLGWHRLKAWWAALRCGFPARGLTIIGITGTDGKTTTTGMAAHILRTCGVPAGAVSTSFFRVLDTVEQNPTHKTSLSPVTLQRFLRRCANAGCTTVVVEASSHGLVQHRLDYLRPSVAAITNIALEHLDYHGTMEQYRKDKSILFSMLRGKGTKVLNRDDDTYAEYRRIASDKTAAYSAQRATAGHDADLWLTNVAIATDSSSAQLHARIGGTEVSLPLQLSIPGSFNLENALCAIAAVSAVGIPPAKAAAALRTFAGIPGRMERIDEGQPFSVFVDFTVTPQAYEKALAALRGMLAPGRILVLTGSCGNRMREKRPLIGKIVSEGADVVVVTEDETLTEDPLKVMDEVWAGVDQARCEAHRIPDRRAAIGRLLRLARPGDVVALCGMGACTTMQTLQGLRPWDEREVARELLRAMRAETR